MQYTSSVRFTGDGDRALALAATVLAANGLRLERHDERTLVATGRGLAGGKQSPLLGASRVTITRAAGELRLEADLGGVRALTRLMLIVPAVIAIALLVLHFALRGSSPPLPPQLLLVLAPWVVLAPALSHHHRRRTTQALDDLLASLATEAGRH